MDLGYSAFLSGQKRLREVREEYCSSNPDLDQDEIEDVLEALKAIKNRQVGVIQLNGSLDIDAVTSIFIRINSQGVPLSQADFVMSKKQPMKLTAETFSENVLIISAIFQSNRNSSRPSRLTIRNLLTPNIFRQLLG